MNIKENFRFHKELFKRLGKLRSTIYILSIIIVTIFVVSSLIFLFFVRVSTLRELIVFFASTASSYIIACTKDVIKDWKKLKEEKNKEFEEQRKQRPYAEKELKEKIEKMNDKEVIELNEKIK